jgi:hypothetical protein
MWNYFVLVLLEDNILQLHCANHDIHGLMIATYEAFKSTDAHIEVVMGDGPLGPGVVPICIDF